MDRAEPVHEARHDARSRIAREVSANLECAGPSHDGRLTGDGDANGINGGAGNDALGGGAGADTIDGGADTDTASYAGSGAAVAVDLGASSASGGDAAGDVLSNIENLTGSIHDDTLTGHARTHVRRGRRASATISGRPAPDTPP